MRTPIFAAALSLAAVVLLPMAPTQSFADTTVNVSLWDKGADVDMPTGLGIGMSGDMSKATMGVKAVPNRAKAGIITFRVKNDSKDTIHEMLVIPIADENTQLPFIADENRVDEEGAHDLGEVAELDPGASGSLTLDLKAGTYALVCNVAGHFMAGMWTIFTVVP
jgi:uncharacterized cupredoxin-like copper-binding protein